MLPFKSNEPEKIFLIFKKGGNIPKRFSVLNENQTTIFSISKNPVPEVSSSYLQNAKFFTFFQKKDDGRVFLFPEAIQEDRERAHSNGN